MDLENEARLAELVDQINAELPRARARGLLGRSGFGSDGQTVFNGPVTGPVYTGPVTATGFHGGEFQQRRPANDAGAIDPAVMRQVVAEVLRQLPAAELGGAQQEQACTAARQALAETEHTQPRQSRLRQLREALMDALSSGAGTGLSDTARGLISLLQQLF